MGSVQNLKGCEMFSINGHLGDRRQTELLHNETKTKGERERLGAAQIAAYGWVGEGELVGVGWEGLFSVLDTCSTSSPEERRRRREGRRKGRLKKEKCFRGFHCQRSHT